MRWLPRTSFNAPRILSWSMALTERMSRASLDLRESQHQVLGGDVFILEPIGLLLGLAHHILHRPGHAQLCAGARGRRSSSPCTICWIRPASVRLLQQRADDAVVLFQQCRQQMQGLQFGMLAASQSCWACMTASCALIVSLSGCMFSPLSSPPRRKWEGLCKDGASGLPRVLPCASGRRSSSYAQVSWAVMPLARLQEWQSYRPLSRLQASQAVTKPTAKPRSTRRKTRRRGMAAKRLKKRKRNSGAWRGEC